MNLTDRQRLENVAKEEMTAMFASIPKAGELHTGTWVGKELRP
jgi:hypothetical protein